MLLCVNRHNKPNFLFYEGAQSPTSVSGDRWYKYRPRVCTPAAVHVEVYCSLSDNHPLGTIQYN